MLTLSQTGKRKGWLEYSYTDSKTGKASSGNVQAGAELTVSAGTRVSLRWRSKDGYVCDQIIVDGAAQSGASGSMQLSMTKNRTFSANWVAP